MLHFASLSAIAKELLKLCILRVAKMKIRKDFVAIDIRKFRVISGARIRKYSCAGVHAKQ